MFLLKLHFYSLFFFDISLDSQYIPKILESCTKNTLMFFILKFLLKSNAYSFKLRLWKLFLILIRQPNIHIADLHRSRMYYGINLIELRLIHATISPIINVKIDAHSRLILQHLYIFSWVA